MAYGGPHSSDDKADPSNGAVDRDGRSIVARPSHDTHSSRDAREAAGERMVEASEGASGSALATSEQTRSSRDVARGTMPELLAIYRAAEQRVRRAHEVPGGLDRERPRHQAALPDVPLHSLLDLDGFPSSAEMCSEYTTMIQAAMACHGSNLGVPCWPDPESGVMVRLVDMQALRREEVSATRISSDPNFMLMQMLSAVLVAQQLYADNTQLRYQLHERLREGRRKLLAIVRQGGDQESELIAETTKFFREANAIIKRCRAKTEPSADEFKKARLMAGLHMQRHSERIAEHDILTVRTIEFRGKAKKSFVGNHYSRRLGRDLQVEYAKAHCLLNRKPLTQDNVNAVLTRFHHGALSDDEVERVSERPDWYPESASQIRLLNAFIEPLLEGSPVPNQIVSVFKKENKDKKKVRTKARNAQFVIRGEVPETDAPWQCTTMHARSGAPDMDQEDWAQSNLDTLAEEAEELTGERRGVAAVSLVRTEPLGDERAIVRAVQASARSGPDGSAAPAAAVRPEIVVLNRDAYGRGVGGHSANVSIGGVLNSGWKGVSWGDQTLRDFIADIRGTTGAVAGIPSEVSAFIRDASSESYEAATTAINAVDDPEKRRALHAMAAYHLLEQDGINSILEHNAGGDDVTCKALMQDALEVIFLTHQGSLSEAQQSRLADIFCKSGKDRTGELAYYIDLFSTMLDSTTGHPDATMLPLCAPSDGGAASGINDLCQHFNDVAFMCARDLSQQMNAAWVGSTVGCGGLMPGVKKIFSNGLPADVTNLMISQASLLRKDDAVALKDKRHVGTIASVRSIADSGYTDADPDDKDLGDDLATEAFAPKAEAIVYPRGEGYCDTRQLAEAIMYFNSPKGMQYLPANIALQKYSDGIVGRGNEDSVAIILLRALGIDQVDAKVVPDLGVAGADYRVREYSRLITNISLYCEKMARETGKWYIQSDKTIDKISAIMDVLLNQTFIVDGRNACLASFIQDPSVSVESVMRVLREPGSPLQDAFAMRRDNGAPLAHRGKTKAVSEVVPSEGVLYAARCGKEERHFFRAAAETATGVEVAAAERPKFQEPPVSKVASATGTDSRRHVFTRGELDRALEEAQHKLRARNPAPIGRSVSTSVLPVMRTGHTLGEMPPAATQSFSSGLAVSVGGG